MNSSVLRISCKWHLGNDAVELDDTSEMFLSYKNMASTENVIISQYQFVNPRKENTSIPEASGGTGNTIPGPYDFEFGVGPSLDIESEH